MKKRNKEEWIPLQKTITQKNREEGDADMLLYENTGYYETLHLEISGGYYTLEDIFIHQKINEHTTIKVTAVVLEEAAMEYEQMLLDHQALRLVQKQGEEELVLFGGMIQKLIVERKDGIYYIYVEGISLTKYIDVRKENASYQNENSTYKDVLNKALQKYHFSGISYRWTEQSRSKPVGRFLLQFQETDWEFIKKSCLYRTFRIDSEYDRTTHTVFHWITKGTGRKSGTALSVYYTKTFAKSRKGGQKRQGGEYLSRGLSPIYPT